MWQQWTRLFRHRWQSNLVARHVISKDTLAMLTAAVDQAETSHSGEIRIYIEASLPTSYLLSSDSMAQIVRRRAMSMFGKLHVWDTRHNNGVLIYLLLAEKRLEIVADRGLNDCVPTDAWERLANGMGTAFKAGDFELGLTQAVHEITSLLHTHFPLAAGQDNPNELPNEPVLG
jgi:uncharacterized membrane protein